MRLRRFLHTGARTPTILLALVCAAAASARCDSRENELDLERQRAIYLTYELLQAAARDFTTPCRNAVGDALACASSASQSSAAYLTQIQNRYGFSTSASDAAGVCESYPQGSFFNRWTDPAKKCYFDCAAQYWRDVRSQSLCTSPTYQTTLNSSDTQILRCAETCFNQASLLP